MGDGGCDGGWGMRDSNLKFEQKSTGHLAIERTL
jgi:hypothetical protein